MKSYLASAATLFVIFVYSAEPLPSSVCDGTPAGTQEIRHSFSVIRSLIQSQDKKISLRIMETYCLKEIPILDRCCFLHHILHLYLNKVFKHYVPQDLKHRSIISHIANSLLVLSEEIQPCHSRNMCDCSDKTSEKIKIIERNFNKLDPISGALKAVGELDNFLDWMEKLY